MKMSSVDMFLYISLQVLHGLLDGEGVVAVEDGVEGLGDVCREAFPLLPLLSRERLVEGGGGAHFDSGNRLWTISDHLSAESE